MRGQGLYGYAAAMTLTLPLTGWRAWVGAGACALLTLVIGVVDTRTGVEIFVSQLYFVPVVAGAWWLGTGFGLAMAALSGVTWIAADNLDAHPFSGTSVSVWNAVSHAVLFAVFAWLTGRLSTALRREREAARADALTGVNNRRAFFELGERALQRAAHDDQALAIAYFDLDEFKSINDRFGHARGDEVLRAFAASLQKALRPGDIVGRIGGDEFAAVIPGVSGAALGDFLERVRAALATDTAVSVGAAIAKGTDFAAAVRAADQVMYEVKRSGKNALRVAKS